MTDDTNGYYEYLPSGYGTSTSSYPLIIYLHGKDDLGNGGTELSKLLSKRLPKLIQDGAFPASFTVEGQTHRFIVLCPQFIDDAVDEPTPEQVDALITFAIDNYRVNATRIYLTGFSVGGGAIWNYVGESSAYADRVAAIVPIAGFAQHRGAQGRIIGEADVAVWATHNDADPVAFVGWTNDYIDAINLYNPSPLAKKTLFPSDVHEGFTRTYDPAFQENGANIYEWMLQHQRGAVALPVTLTGFKVSALNHTAVVTWSTGSESNNGFFTVERSPDGTSFTAIGQVPGLNRPSQYQFIDAKPASGDNFYRLSQTDQDGRVTYFQVQKLSFGITPGNELLIQPNPAISQLQIGFEHPETGPVTFAIVSASGAVVKQWTGQKGTLLYREKVSLLELQAGSYFLQARGKTLQYTKGFIKAANQ